MKRNFLFCLFGLIAFGGYLYPQAFKVRAISDIQSVRLNTGQYSVQAENTFLIPVSDGWSVEVKNSMRKTDYSGRIYLQPGFVWAFLKNTYVETVYGVAVDTDNNISWDGYSEIVFENEKVILSACFRAGYVPVTGIFFTVPNTSALYRFSKIYALKAKYFFGFSTDDFLSHTLQFENIFTAWKNTTLACLVSGTVSETAGVEGYSWTCGIRYERYMLQNFLLKCNAGYLRESSDVWGLNCGITFDMRF